MVSLLIVPFDSCLLEDIGELWTNGSFALERLTSIRDQAQKISYQALWLQEWHNTQWSARIHSLKWQINSLTRKIDSPMQIFDSD